MKNEQKQNSTLVSDVTNASVQHDKHKCLKRCTPVSSVMGSSAYQSPVQSTKKCLCCQRELPLNAFYTRDKQHHPDTYCKDCRKEANRIRRKTNDPLPEEKVPARCYPVITNIKQRDVRLELILSALQTVRQSMACKRRKQCEREYFS